MSDSENEIQEEEQHEDFENLLEDDDEQNRDNQEEAEEEEEEEEVHEEQQVESDEEEFAGFGEEEIKQTKKIPQRKVLSDDEEGGEELEEQVEDEEEVGGGGEDEAEEVTEEQAEAEEAEAHLLNPDDLDAENSQNDSIGVDDPTPIKKKKKKGDQERSDLEEAIEKSKSKKKKRKNNDSEAITNIDNIIASLVTEMKNAAAEDRAANEKRICSVKKLKMLELVTNMLQKSEHFTTMIELGMLSAITEWLAPLPDRSLPNIKIREILINALQEFGEIDTEFLKSSGIGKAVMFLFKHPKETKPNKEKLEKLIHNWSRPIFSLDSNFKGLTKEERQQRDMEHVRTFKRRSLSEENNSDSVDIDNVLGDLPVSKKTSKKPKSDDIDETNKTRLLRPGDPGFVPRARVPLPSSKDYVIRPKSNVDNIEMQEKKSKKTEVSRYDKHKRRFVEQKKHGKSGKAVLMSIEGRKLPL